MKTTCNCGATWTGLRIEHCTACHETFTGTGSGDKHRVGDHAVDTGPSARRCLSPDEMRAKGMAQNARGVWTLGGTSPWSKNGCYICQPDNPRAAEEGCSDCEREYFAYVTAVAEALGGAE